MHNGLDREHKAEIKADERIKEYAHRLMTIAMDRGCDGAEVCVNESEEFSVGVLEDEVDEYTVSSSFGLGIRVQKDGRNGYAYTEAMDDPEGFVEEAIDNAETVKSEDIHPMAEPAEYPEIQKKTDALKDMDESEKIELCKALERETKRCDGRVKRVAYCKVVTAGGRFCIYNTLGLRAERSDRVSCCYVEPVLEDKGQMRDGFAFRADGEALDIAGCAREAVDEAIAAMDPAPVAPGKYDIILRNDAMASILGAFAGMFSADAAQKGLSPLAGREGEDIAAECVTLMDDPLYPINPSPFDDEGTPSVAKAVIKDGKLETLLHNLKTAKKAGVKSTSNGGRSSAGSPVGVRITNFYIAPKEGTLGQLISELGDGLLITDFSGLHAGVNPVSGKFSVLCKGRLIKDGRDVRAVNEITLSGDFTELLRSIVRVGGDLRFSMPGGSCVGSPSVMVRGAMISGRGDGGQ